VYLEENHDKKLAKSRRILRKMRENHGNITMFNNATYKVTKPSKFFFNLQ